MKPTFLPAGRRGATLVEAVLAIGVLSIVSLGIWGGLSVGLQRTNALKNLTEMAQIRDYLFSQVEGGTNTVTNLPASNYFFDDEGLMLTSNTNAWAYQAQMFLVSSTSPVIVPNTSGVYNTNLLSVCIQVTARSGVSKTNYQYFAHP